jgi:molybdenum cofactor guanylyltransferase
MERKNVNGLVLGGGKSSRMKQDKSRIVYHDEPQANYLARVLHQYCDNVFFSCKQGTAVPENISLLYDQFNIETPLNGLLSAIEKDKSCAWITIPVDMPYVTDEVIGYLFQNRNPEKFATCFFDSDGIDPEPLFCIWEPKSFPHLRSFFNEGNISPKKFLKRNPVHLVKTDPYPNLNMNVNTPEELTEYYNQKSLNR